MGSRDQAMAEARARAVEAASRRTDAQIRGLEAVVRSLDFGKDAADVLSSYLGAAADVVLGEAKRRAPVDVGLLKASINRQVRKDSDYVVTASIGTNVARDGRPYGAFMEYGTGLVHDHPTWPRKRHVVPPAALMGWAERKGRGGTYHDAWVIADAITRRGGLKPRRYLRGSLEIYSDRIKSQLGQVVAEIRRRRGI